MRVEVPDVTKADLKQASGRGVVFAARVGYLAQGVVYGLVGTLALLSVFRQSGGRVTDSKGALERVHQADYGGPMLWAVAFGLACYALWSIARALLDPQRVCHGGAGVAKRIGYAVSAVTHSVLAIYAGQLAYGAAHEGEGEGQERTIGQVLDLPGGQIAIALVGAAVIGFGVYQLVAAWKNQVAKEFSGGDLPPARHRLVMRIARLGMFARGVVFPLIGGSLIAAALHANASEARSFGEALSQLASQQFGNVLLGLVALGLLAYAVHMLFVARYASISNPA